MGLAESVARRSTCRRLQVGTVLVSPDNQRVIALGYNGNAKNFRNDCDSEEPGNCGDIHSEINALIKADTRQRFVAYITTQPCKICAKALVNAGVLKVVYRYPYRITDGLDVLEQAKIPVEKID